jgi:hypothetical protein
MYYFNVEINGTTRCISTPKLKDNFIPILQSSKLFCSNNTENIKEYVLNKIEKVLKDCDTIYSKPLQLIFRNDKNENTTELIISRENRPLFDRPKFLNFYVKN